MRDGSICSRVRGDTIPGILSPLILSAHVYAGMGWDGMGWDPIWDGMGSYLLTCTRGWDGMGWVGWDRREVSTHVYAGMLTEPSTWPSSRYSPAQGGSRVRVEAWE